VCRKENIVFLGELESCGMSHYLSISVTISKDELYFFAKGGVTFVQWDASIGPWVWPKLRDDGW